MIILLFLLFIFASCQNNANVMGGQIHGSLKHTRYIEYKVNRFLILKSGSISVYEGEYLDLPVKIYKFNTLMEKVHQKNLQKSFTDIMIKDINSEGYKIFIDKMTSHLIDINKNESIYWYIYDGSIFQEQQDKKNAITFRISKLECPHCSNYFEETMNKFSFQ